MESEKAELAAIGAAIRTALDNDSASSDHIRTARAGVIRYVTLPRARGLLPGVWHWMHAHSARPRYLAASIAGALAIMSLWIWLRQPISFQVDRIGASERVDIPGRVGDPIEATGSLPIALRFSEGSSIVLEEGGRARVLSAESEGARVLLETGTAEVSIAHRAQHGTRWNFDAGPFQVLVVGTKFRVSWNPHRQSFGLLTWEGAVVVTGKCLDEKRTVAAGEHIDITCAPPPAAMRQHEPGVDAPEGEPSNAGALALPGIRPEPSTEAAPKEDVADEEPVVVGASAGGHGSSPKKWREMLRAGKFPEAYRLAERADFGQLCRTARASDLMALADAARLAGHVDRAIEALLAVRQRFRGSPDAATAAFALGRIAFDKQNAFGEAVRWFTTYLREHPSGPLMGDAVGRLMESRWRQGDRQGARADAQRYLLRFPEGPYASRAREMLYE